MSSAERYGDDERVDRLDEMLGRWLGPVILDAIADPDITEIYVNPQDRAIRFDSRSRRKIDSGQSIDAHRVEMFLNAVATRLGTMLTNETPRRGCARSSSACASSGCRLAVCIRGRVVAHLR